VASCITDVPLRTKQTEQLPNGSEARHRRPQTNEHRRRNSSLGACPLVVVCAWLSSPSVIQRERQMVGQETPDWAKCLHSQHTQHIQTGSCTYNEYDCMHRQMIQAQQRAWLRTLGVIWESESRGRKPLARDDVVTASIFQPTTSQQHAQGNQRRAGRTNLCAHSKGLRSCSVIQRSDDRGRKPLVQLAVVTVR
jgi:hypothetical protein